MASAVTCPPTEELRRLLDGSLAGERQRACTEHLDACECCQVRLEEMATEGTHLSQVVKSLHQAEPEATSPYWRSLKALDADIPLTPLPRPAAARRELALDFLEPP